MVRFDEIQEAMRRLNGRIEENEFNVKRLETELENKFPGVNLNTNHVYTFEALLVAADAYKRAGTTAPQALAQAMRATNIKANASLSDGISFDEKGQNNGLKIAGIQNVGGTTKVVIPVASSEQKPTFPMPGWHADPSVRAMRR